jgi:hypothetical protein
VPELDEQFWWGMRSLATNLTGGQLGFVISLQRPPQELLQSSGQPSPFFNIFGHLVPLGPFTHEEAEELIASSPLPFSEEDVDWIITRSRGWPALVQILCQARLTALQEELSGDEWKADADLAMFPYLHLLDRP